MMKKLCLIWILTVIGFWAEAQSSIAKLNFEEAEEAYNKGDYTKALEKLELSEKNFGGPNLPIKYLRILSQDKLIRGISDAELIYIIKQHSKAFLIDYQEEDGIEEKYREIYKISEKYSSYPSTKEELLKLKLNQEDEVGLKLQRVKSIWDKYLATKGGKEGWSAITSIYTEEEGVLQGLKVVGKTWVIPDKIYSYEMGEMKIFFDRKENKGEMYFHKAGSAASIAIEEGNLALLRLAIASPYEMDEITNEKLISCFDEELEGRKVTSIKINLSDLIVEGSYDLTTGLKQRERVWYAGELLGTTVYKSFTVIGNLHFPKEYTTETKGVVGSFTVKNYKLNQKYNEKELRKP